MDKEHLKVKMSQVKKAAGEACAQVTMGNELSITGKIPEMLLQQNLKLMEENLTKGNLQLAYETVVKNKGCAGIDGMRIDQLKEYLKGHWPEIKQQLLANKYLPQSVKKVEIPKAGSGKRMLGIPTVRINYTKVTPCSTFF